MARAVKKDIECIWLIDSREKNTAYVKDLIDSRVSKDGIKFIGHEVVTFKPNGCDISTGDCGFKYREKGTDNEWIETTFCCEIKRGTDAFSSLHLADNRRRIQEELNRAKEYGLDFYFIVTDDFESINKAILKIPKFRNTNTHNTNFENFMKLQEMLLENGFIGSLVSGNDLPWLIRRLAKRHIIKNKLQYKC